MSPCRWERKARFPNADSHIISGGALAPHKPVVTMGTLCFPWLLRKRLYVFGVELDTTSPPEPQAKPKPPPPTPLPGFLTTEQPL